MSRTRKIIGASSIGYLQQAAMIGVGVWLTPFLLGRIGQHDLGLWLVAGQLLGYLGLVDLGILAILPREVARVSAQPDGDQNVSSLVAHVRRIVLWQTAGLALICLTLLVLLPAQWIDLRWPLACVFAVFVGAYPLRIPSAALQGLQDLPYLAKVQMVGWAAGTSVTVVLVMMGWSLPALVAGWSVTLLAPAAAAAWRFRRSFAAARSHAKEPVGDQYLRRSLWVSAGQLGQVFLSGSDVLVIGNILGAAAVVPYSCTAKLVTIFANHPQLLIHTAQPALTELRAAGAKDRLVTVAQALTQGMLIMSGALVLVVIAVNRFFVSWWVGTDQYGGLGLTVALAAMMLLRHWNVATVYTLFCFGYERQLSLVVLADGVVTIAGTAWLVSVLGPVGAPLASGLGALFVGLPVNLRSVAKEMDVSIPELLRPSATLVATIASVIGLTVFVSEWSDSSHLLNAAAVASGMMTLYAVAMLPFVTSGPLKPYARTALSMIPIGRLRHRTATA